MFYSPLPIVCRIKRLHMVFQIELGIIYFTFFPYDEPC